MRESNPDLTWEEYSELIEDMKDSEPRELTPEEMKPYIDAMNFGCCIRCHKPLPEGYDGKVCMDCRLEMS